ncbi:MAG TPA: C25 family cysteine peptidase [Bacteroidales bacterium]|nr:C25 family cysteine peptidase [Bacteroidales bacterium]
MQKVIFKFLLFPLLIGNLLNAQVTSTGNYTISKNNFDKISISFTTDNLKYELVQEGADTYTRLFMDGYYASRDVGNPILPELVKIIEIPLCDDIILNYSYQEERTISGYEIGIREPLLPAQPSYPKSFKGKRNFAKNNATYSTNEFYGQPLVKVEKIGVLRNTNMATLYVSPIKYNPVTNEFKIYNKIDVEITFKNADVAATEEMKRLHTNHLFTDLPVINPFSSRSKNEFNTVPIKYLIVSHSSFRNQLDEFIAWKKRKGYIVEVGYTDDPNVGTDYNSIENYIHSFYTNATPENPAPTFVLLVGDVAQIPAKEISTGGWWSTRHPSDLYYFTWTEGDYLPDCYYGRFSANSIAELTPQIKKTLMYEQLSMPDPSYLDKAVLIAGTDNYWSQTHADGQINYISSNYFTPEYGYTTIHKHNYNCSSQDAEIRTEIGEGVGFANYTAHGDVTEWCDPVFKASQITNMQNENKYGLMIGNCCLSNKFDETSFGESLVRAQKKGALAYIGASNSTYWDEDVYWAVGLRNEINANMSYDPANLGMYDRLFHTHNEPYSSWFTTLGGMITAGNLGVESSSSAEKNYYWEIYHLMGDPSTTLWLTQPDVMTVTHSALFNGMTSLQVNTVPYAYVAITDNLELIAAGFTDENGDVELNFPPLNYSPHIELTASAQNYKTYFEYLHLTPLSINHHDSNITIYPNPASEYTVINSNDAINRIELFDMMGKTVKIETNINDNNLIVNLNNLSSGVYFLKITNVNNQSFIKKIVKE